MDITIMYKKYDVIRKIPISEFNSFAPKLSYKKIVLGGAISEDLGDATLSEIVLVNNHSFYSYSHYFDGPCKMSKETWKSFLKEHLNSSTIRSAIPAPLKYFTLAIDYIKLPIVKPFLSLWGATYLISPLAPILYSNSVWLNSKVKFIEDIVSTSEFHSLTTYVHENRAEPTPCTKEDIIETYKRLLSEYYDVMHEDETVKGESGDE